MRWSRTVQGETADSPRFAKRYENLLGQTIREERSGFQGAVLATAHVYDSYGRLASTAADYEPVVEYLYDASGARYASIRRADGQWRKSESIFSFAVSCGMVWLTQTNIVSCSDLSISPLVTSSSSQYTGLSHECVSRTCRTDIRGNIIKDEMFVSPSLKVFRQTSPYASNNPESISRYGIAIMDVSTSTATNNYMYDALGRPIAHTGGRGNETRVEYNTNGQQSSFVDAIGNRATYTYDRFGNLISIADPLGHEIVYEYDLRNRKIYEGGATYPVRYSYDVFDNMTAMTTYRDESLGSNFGDVTTWYYDEASGAMTNKVYADGKGTTYSYTPEGNLSLRVWARGIVTEYFYDVWGNLTNTEYSDDTPSVSLTYDALGRKVEAHDAAGVTTFLYDSFGALTNETVVGVAGTNMIERYWDAYGRTVGYGLNGMRQTTIGYDHATGQITSMFANGSDVPFVWSYLHGTGLKSSLAYPNGLKASWNYDANSQLLQVKNAFPTNTISQYDYMYDAAGRRVRIAKSGSAMSKNCTDVYGYNARGELISVARVGGSQSPVIEYAYEYDDIGNRISSSDLGLNCNYVANNLNQYTTVSNFSSSASFVAEFSPQFDDDGNQTMIKTSTGIWQVLYNGENRPISWSCGPTNIVMSFDHMGRRVRYLEICDSITNGNHAFVYDGYLPIGRNQRMPNGISKTCHFVWDITESIATRPLVLCAPETPPLYYTHDGNKNVSELVAGTQPLFVHYGYSPFGVITDFYCNVVAAELDMKGCNQFCFSSECLDDLLGLVYYNNRHYNAPEGRWLSRDINGNRIMLLYNFLSNSPIVFFDILGNDYWEFSDNDSHCGIPLFSCNGDSCGGLVPQLYRSSSLVCARLKDVLEPAEIVRSFYTGCCRGKPYDTRTHCCENGQVVEKVSIWVGNRALDSTVFKKMDFWPFRHTFYLCKDPRSTGMNHGDNNPEYGKEPVTCKMWKDPFAMLFSIGKVKAKGKWACDGVVFTYDVKRIKEKKVCPATKRKICTDRKTIIPYIFLPPFNCWAFTWGVIL